MSGVVLIRYQPTGQTPSSEYSEAYAWTDEQIKSQQAAPDADRVLASILLTDAVDSTGRAAAVMDRSWRQLLGRHGRAAHAEVERFRGRLVKTNGDGISATFDAPTRALRSAFELIEALAGSGLGIRAAIHTGEIELLDEEVGGDRVHIAFACTRRRRRASGGRDSDRQGSGHRHPNRDRATRFGPPSRRVR